MMGFLIRFVSALVLTAMSVTSCGDRRGDRFVACMDSLYQQNPQAAIDSIDSFMAHESPSRRNRMTLSLYRLRAQNSADIPFKSDSVARLVVEYFDEHGTVQQQMSAYYVLGSVYRDLGNSPEALAQYQHAVELADTTSTDTDYRLLLRIYGQIGDVLYYQLALNEAREAYGMAEKCAYKIGDTLEVLIEKEQVASVLYVQGHKDEACQIREALHEKYKKYGYMQEASKVLAPAIHTMLKHGRVDEVGQILDDYERLSGNVDKNGNAVPGKEQYYGDKGEYMAAKGDCKGALSCFQKGLSATADSHEFKEYFFRKIAALYRMANNPDSAAKYSELSRRENDSAYVSLSTARMQQMFAAYNYSVKEKETQNARQKEHETKTVLLIALIVFFVIVVAMFWIICQVRRSKALERAMRILQIEGLEKENERRKAEIEMLENEKRELDVLMSDQREKINELIEDKKNLIYNVELQKTTLLNIRKQKMMSDVSGDEKEKTVVSDLWNVVDKRHRTATRQEWKRLELYVSEFYPVVSSYKNKVSDAEYEVMMLVKLKFKPSEIAVLTGLSMSNIANVRKRLYERLTGNKGSARDFDEFVKELI